MHSNYPLTFSVIFGAALVFLSLPKSPTTALTSYVRPLCLPFVVIDRRLIQLSYAPLPAATAH